MGRLRKWVSLFLIAAAIPVPLQAKASCQLAEDEVEETAEEIGAEYNICPELLAAIAFRESAYNPDAEYDGCIGLMQVSPKWHAERMKLLCVDDLRNPYANMLVAADYLEELFRDFQDTGMVLMVYNGDLDAEDYWAGKADLSEYAQDIMQMSEKLERKHRK